MADVFVSYARADQRLAGTIAERLTRAGFSVWWDTELLPHNRFATEIEQQIQAAGALLVIWSRAAAASPWVRAEAELGRSEGKLIQVSIDDCAIPLPFNQYQLADLRHWHGNDANQQWQKVLASVAHFSRNGRGETADSRSASASTIANPGRGRALNHRRKLAFGVVVAIAIAGGGGTYLLRSGSSGSRGARIAVQPFLTIGDSSALNDFAVGMSDSLQNALTDDQLQMLSPTDAATLKGGNLAAKSKALDVGLLFSGTVKTVGSDIDVNMRLDDPEQHASLWTAELSGPAAKAEQLQARVAALTLAVLNCSQQALAPNVRISDSALQAFLRACELSQTAAHGLAGGQRTYAMLDAMRQAARAAPNFAAAHSVLSKHLAFVAAYHLLDHVEPIRDEAQSEARRALALDPKDPDGFVTLGLLAPPLDFAMREGFYRKALATNPGWSHANGFLGNVMTDTGRLEDAVSLYQRAASVNQRSNDWAIEAVGGLIRIGNTEQADRELAGLFQLWPNDAENLRYQLQSYIAQRRWSDGIKLLNQASNFPDDFTPSWIANWRRLLETLQSNDPAARQALREDLIASASTNPRDSLQGLALLGFLDDAFPVALHQLRIDPTQEDSAGSLFDPELAPLLHDPRFMMFAARYGLVNYWLQTGRWPDFCTRPALPYNCAAQAKRFATKARV